MSVVKCSVPLFWSQSCIHCAICYIQKFHILKNIQRWFASCICSLHVWFWRYHRGFLLKWLEPCQNFRSPTERLLVLDCLVSQCSKLWLKFCRENNSEFLCLLPHTTHALQPLDHILFRPLQIFLQEGVIAFIQHHPNKSITKSYFGKDFTPSWNRKRQLKKGKEKIFQKNLIRSNMAKICDFISSGFFQRRKKRGGRYSWRCSCWVLWTNTGPMSQQ